jgi:hypothetical protein
MKAIRTKRNFAADLHVSQTTRDMGHPALKDA